MIPLIIRVSGKQFVHGSSLLFATHRRTLVRTVLLAIFCAVRCSQPDKMGRLVSFPGILRQRCECALGNVFRQVRIADHPQGSGIDQVSIAANQFGKCCLGPASGIITQELLVGQCAHLKKITATIQPDRKRVFGVFAISALARAAMHHPQ